MMILFIREKIGGDIVDKNVKITKRDIRDMKLLTDEELRKLNFTELCIYLNTLEIAENVLEGSED